MPFNLDSFSRFRYTERIKFDGKQTFGMWTEPAVFGEIKRDDVILHKVDITHAGRVDLISQMYYGSDRYYWVIIMWNKPLNPVGWPKQDEIIEIPPYSSIASLL